MEQNEWEIPEGEALERAMAQAYRLYQDNIRNTGADIYRLTKGARGDVHEEELLDLALQALDKCRME